MGIVAAVSYLILIFLFNELRLGIGLSWRRRRRQRVERFMLVQARRMLVAVHRLVGLRYTFDTTAAGPLPERFLLVTNHQSLADIPMLVAAFPHHPLKFVAKDSLRRGIPTLSKCLRYGEHAFIDRGGPFRRTLRVLRRLAQLDRAGAAAGYAPCSFAVFPEGTRSRDGNVAPFYRAGLRVLAEQTGLPVVTAALDGGTAIARVRTLRNLAGVHYRVRVLAIHPPPVGKTGAAELLARARREIANQVAAWRPPG